MNEICTVLLISYNHAPYIQRALDSVLQQKTGYNFRIDVFDDGSTDGTQDIIRKYVQLYPGKIRAFLSEKNQGAQANFWRAYQSIETKYFNVLECDDYFCDENKLQLQIDALERHPECSFCGHDTYLVSLGDSFREYEEGSLCCTEPLLRQKVIFTLKDFDPINTGGYIPYPSARMVRTVCLHLDKVKYKESVLFDFTSFYYLLLQGKYYYINRPMSVYQRTGHGTCSGITPMEFLNTFISNAIDFNKETNNCIAEKIFRDCMLQTSFRLKLSDKQPKIISPPKRKQRKEHGEALISDSTEYDLWGYVNTLELDTTYYLCNGGIGSLLLTLGLKSALKKRYGEKICFLVQKKHAFVMKLLGEEEYLIADISNMSSASIEALSSQCPNVQKGEIYVTHPFAHREKWNFCIPILSLSSSKHYCEWYMESLDLPKDALFILPKYGFPELGEKLSRKIECIPSLEKTVAFFPEAYTLSGIETRFWAKKARKLRNQGFTVISCVKDEQNTIPGTLYVDLTLEEAIILASHCHSVYASRNGVCDLLAPLGDRLTVYYTSHSAFYIYGMEPIYGKLGFHEEIIIAREAMPQTFNVGQPAKRHARFLGVIPVPNFIYRFYLRHRGRLQYFKRFVSWSA